jgi:hypothetical protein
MGTNAIRFILLLLLSLLIGTMFGIWVGFNPASLSAAAYVEQQQNSIRSLNTLLPVMGAVCILLARGLVGHPVKEQSAKLLPFRRSHRVLGHCCVGHALWQPAHQCSGNHMERSKSTGELGATARRVVAVACRPHTGRYCWSVFHTARRARINKVA